MILVYTTQVNSTFRARWWASSEVISQVLFTSEQPKKNKAASVGMFSQSCSLGASYSACVVYTKTIIHLSVSESGGYLPPLRWIIVNYCHYCSGTCNAVFIGATNIQCTCTGLYVDHVIVIFTDDGQLARAKIWSNQCDDIILFSLAVLWWPQVVITVVHLTPDRVVKVQALKLISPRPANLMLEVAMRRTSIGSRRE